MVRAFEGALATVSGASDLTDTLYRAVRGGGDAVAAIAVGGPAAE